MWLSKEFLARCEKLHALGFSSGFEPGTRIARGFADLGFEEFLLLPGEKLLSIYSGKIGAWRDEERAHFFVVPEIDQMLAEIDRLEFDVASITSRDRRNWEMELRDSRDGAAHGCAARSLNNLVLEGLIIAQSIRSAAGRRRAEQE